MTTTISSQERIAQAIAGKVFLGELAATRALGYSERDAIKLAFAALDETYLRSFAIEMPAVWPFQILDRWVRKPTL